MARYLRDPSRDHPLPRSFRHRGLHHGSGSTQNQARPGPQIRRARIHGYVQVTAVPRAPPSGPISFRTQKYERKGWTQGEGAEGTVGLAFSVLFCTQCQRRTLSLPVLSSLNPAGTRYWQDVWTTCIVPTSLRSSAAHFTDKGASKEWGGGGGPC